MRIADARAGAIVRLNGETFRMTVSRVDGSGKIVAEWHDDAGQSLESDYAPAMLTLVKPAPDDEDA